MTTVAIAGEISSALTHFSGLGLAAILESAGLSSIRLWWSDDEEPQLFVSVPNADEGSIGMALADHVQAMADCESWVQLTLTHEGRNDTGLFSPRIKPPSKPEAWSYLQQLRHNAIDSLLRETKRASLTMVGALGEPAYWRTENGQIRPDEGASRWEMKTRNRGEEFIGNRLAPMAALLARRTPTELIDGVTGQFSRDEINGTIESRSATGLQRPGPVDTARAWTALWGLTSFPVIHRPEAISATACAFPRHRLHTRWMVLPIVDRPVSLERWRSIIASESLTVLGEQIAANGPGCQRDSAAVAVLTELGTAALGIAPVNLGGTSSAPERAVLDVSVWPLDHGRRHD